MDKVVASCAEAVKDIPNGASIAVGGFGLNGIPHNTIAALLERGVAELAIVSNNCGVDGWGLGVLLDAKRIRRITAFYTPAGVGTQVADGGLPWRYNADGSIALASPKKDVRTFGGREYALEEGIVTDFAFVRASVGDRHGNLIFHKATRNFNPLCAMAGKITIAEVEELVEPGAIDPEQVHLPGIFVQRVVQVGAGGKRIERVTTRRREGGS